MADIIVLTKDAKTVLSEICFREISARTDARENSAAAKQLEILHRIYNDVVNSHPETHRGHL